MINQEIELTSIQRDLLELLPDRSPTDVGARPIYIKLHLDPFSGLYLLPLFYLQEGK